ncbi:efflux RND transporter permease subunit [Aliidiomarina halalkaliphila]|uniref:Efflux RND transporter permease subunit n=1 Tax=Aliidiomarina halalkaliphila TaxID=2593535 RepID=A0A552X3F1_9GAMM|nr:efflux RND transporter permease subunit [Aliidiomarina halalkaliphila]TRW49515.1 efflux RND transporter permease subunit [Aliidiomarina halalkaliphila]
MNNKNNKGIAALAVRRPVTIVMVTLAILLFGMVSLGRLPVNLLPDLSYPTLTVRTAYIGAAPTEIEQLINRPIEESLGTVRGVRTITSYARAGQSDIVLEFAWGTNMDMAGLEVREKLDTVWLPVDIEKPVILRFNPNMEPIMRFALNREEALSPSELQNMRRYADEELKRQLESIPGIAAVRVGGGLEDEIQVLVDEHRASQLNIDVQTIVQRLRAENVNQASGRIETTTLEFLVRTVNQFQSLEDIGAIYIATRNNTPIQLQDIAEIRHGYRDRTSMSRVNGRESIELNLYREGDANTVQVADEVRRRLPAIERQLPRDFQLQLLNDQSGFIRNAIQAVKQNALIGGALAMLVILLFLRHIRPTLIISVAIPVSIVATFLFMFMGNLSLNMMSLGGIALAVGLLVDNAIVVLENISRRREQGDSIPDAAIQGTKEVTGAVTAATLTTLAVFVPLIFVSGMAGQLFTDQAITVSVALVASLLVALTLIPMLASRQFQTAPANAIPDQSPAPPTRRGFWYWLAWPFRSIFRALFYWLPVLVLGAMRATGRAISRAAQWVSCPLLQGFERGLERTSTFHGRVLTRMQMKPGLYFLIFASITLACFSLLPRIGAELIPQMEQREFYVDVQLPRGTPITRTDGFMADFAQHLSADSRVEKTYSVAGTGSLMQVQANQGGDFWGRIHVVLVQGLQQSDRDEVIQFTRDYLARQPDVQARVDYPELVTVDMPLMIELIGYDLDRLLIASEHIANQLEAHDNFTDVRNGLTAGQPELEIQFDHARLAWAGLSAPDVARLVSTHIGGQVATRYNMMDRQIDIRVRLPDAARQQPERLGDLIVNPGADVEIPLSAVANIHRAIGPSEITRLGQQRVALVSARASGTDVRQAQQYLTQIIDNSQFPPGVSARIGGQSELLEESYSSMMLALALAIFLVYLVMASQFESFGHPLLIMFSVPLAVAGSVVGLWLTNTPLSVVVFIGLIMLCGIVVNNAIVLVDRINQLRSEGIEKITAIRTAANQRLRPILMTTLTTVLGLLPLALGIGEGAELSASMAIAVISGLLFATALTLLFIPLVYQLFDRKHFAVEVENA